MTAARGAAHRRQYVVVFVLLGVLTLRRARRRSHARDRASGGRDRARDPRRRQGGAHRALLHAPAVRDPDHAAHRARAAARARRLRAHPDRRDRVEGRAMKTALALAMALVPALALACPVCARDQSPTSALLVGGMIVAPYVVAALVIRAIRAAGGER